MAAVEVPIQVGLANEAAKICLEPQSGPSMQPVLSIMFSMQIPIAALVAALLDFQSKAEQVGRIPIAEEHEPLPARAPTAGTSSAPPTAGTSDTASDQESAAAAWLDQSTPTQMPAGALTGPEEPASAVLAVESQPAQSATTRGKGGRAEQ